MKKSEYLTIQDFADKVGQSRQSIYKRLSTDLSTYVVKVDKQKMLKIGAFALFDCQPNCQPTVNEVDKIYNILQTELKAKNDIIKSQQETINKLTIALENTTQSLQASQALHAGTIQQQIEQKDIIHTEEPKEKKIRFEKVKHFFKRE